MSPPTPRARPRRVSAPVVYLLTLVDDLGDGAERVRRYRSAALVVERAERALGRFSTTEIHELRPEDPARLVTDWADGSAGEGNGMLPPSLTVYRRAAPVAAFPPGRVALSIRETAEALGISERTANELMLRGGLPSARVGGRRLVPVAALERWLDEQARRGS